MSWRPTANRIITRIILDNPTLDEQQLRRRIRAAYPWGERALHPYKIWCSAVKECLWTLRKIGRKQTKADKAERTLFNEL